MQSKVLLDLYFQWILIIMNETIYGIAGGEWIRNLSGITVNLVTTKDLWENNWMIQFLIVAKFCYRHFFELTIRGKFFTTFYT